MKTERRTLCFDKDSLGCWYGHCRGKDLRPTTRTGTVSWFTVIHFLHRDGRVENGRLGEVPRMAYRTNMLAIMWIALASDISWHASLSFFTTTRHFFQHAIFHSFWHQRTLPTSDKISCLWLYGLTRTSERSPSTSNHPTVRRREARGLAPQKRLLGQPRFNSVHPPRILPQDV